MTRHIAVVVFGVLVLLAGCGGTGEQGATSDSASTTQPNLRAGVPGVPPKPDEATAAAYVADLEAIDPDIVHGKAGQGREPRPRSVFQRGGVAR